jgi:ribonuclease HI
MLDDPSGSHLIRRRQTVDEIHIFIDGGCRGNGGASPESYGSYAVVYQGQVRRLERFASPDARTNNEAEYASLLMAFTYLDGFSRRMGDRPFKVVVNTDSQLIHGQLTLNWKAKAANLRGLVDACKTWLTRYQNVTIHKVGREEIVKILGH